MSERIKAGRGAVICPEAELLGDITIGEGTVVHPSCRILARDGPIIIGDRNIVEENCVIINKTPEGSESKHVLVIGDSNTFEVGCRVECVKVGSGNVFECRSTVSGAFQIGDGCVVGAGVVLPPVSLPNETVVYGPECTQRTNAGQYESNVASTDKVLEILQRTLPKYHRAV